VKIIQFNDSGEKIGPARVAKMHKTGAEWKQQLSPLQFDVLAKRGRKERSLANVLTYMTKGCIAAFVAATHSSAQTRS
jgi:hypothetical protein